MSRLLQLSTFARLGVTNVARVAAYRIGLRFGRHPVQKLSATVAEAPFFHVADIRPDVPAPNVAWDQDLWWFGWFSQSHDNTPPDWFANPFASSVRLDANEYWWQISDFGTGDIKGVWELSRFDWVVAFATQAANGDTVAMHRLNEWLSDWSAKNPPYTGPNWKCGQEASIRVMHLVAAAWVLGQDDCPETGLIELLITHMQRIAPTMSYAIGQDNNHGTSEAAALFVGGSFLLGHDKRAGDWMRKGRRWLEERAAHLIESDGSFSQYSVTYHRVMLDTYAFCEAWRLRLGLPAFSNALLEKLNAATKWLWAFTDENSGNAPNIGANDGARLLQLTGGDYRDFRPSVQLAAALFCDADAFGAGPWASSLRWLGIPAGRSQNAQYSKSFDNGGYHILRCADAMVAMRYPRFRFRPSQADALHVDLWRNGVNILRDAGTFSYNADGAEWFSGTSAHNTVSFDCRDQMPRLGRFLFGRWLKSETVECVKEDASGVTAAAAYTDQTGARHHRKIYLSDEGLTCIDTISGAFDTATLRWRMAPDDWRQEGERLIGPHCTITIDVDGQSVVPKLGKTKESRYYQHSAEIPEAVYTVHGPATLITKVRFS